MEKFHGGMDTIGSLKVLKVLDYSKGLDGLPKSDVLNIFWKKIAPWLQGRAVLSRG